MISQPVMLIALIPAYNPLQTLLAYVVELQQQKVFSKIVVVDDGSQSEDVAVFSKLEQIPNVILLKHAVNQGKGAALKTGLNYISYEFPGVLGVVTIDADGQHSIEDASAVADALIKNPGHLVVGGRKFSKNTPFRSAVGNFFTRHFFRLVTGLKLFDTQSGLRGVPASMIPDLLTLEANGYEFELDMLMHTAQWGVLILEVPIQTIYLEHNQHSSFRPVWDSLRIYFTLFRFSIIAVLSACVDYGLFILVYYFVHPSVGLALVAGRIVSTTFNYLNVRRYAFRAKKLSHWKTLPQYLALACFSGLMAWLLITGLMITLHWHVVAAKVVAEIVMFFVNFLVQRDFIFRRSI